MQASKERLKDEFQDRGIEGGMRERIDLVDVYGCLDLDHLHDNILDFETVREIRRERERERERERNEPGESEPRGGVRQPPRGARPRREKPWPLAALAPLAVGPPTARPFLL